MIKNWAINITMLVISSLIGIVITELLLRTLLSIETKRIIYDQTRDVYQYNPKHVQFHPYTGYINKPNLNVAFGNKEFNTNIQTNSSGFRDDEESNQNPNVLILGDSFGFGWGVEKDENMEAVLEKKSGLSILNMSVSGYNNVQELALLEEWEKTNSLKDKTLLLLYYVNDMYDNVSDASGLSPLINKTDDSIIMLPPKLTAYNNWISGASTGLGKTLAKNFYTLYYLRNLYAYIRSFWTEKELENKSSVINPEIGNQIRSFRSILKRFSIICKGQNCKMIIVYIPHSPHFKSSRYTKEYFILKFLVASFNFDLVDLSGRLNEKDYYLLDEHWNRNGNERVASILNGYLIKKYQ
jgi:hypothetical protein